jgi:ribose transport system substrate-binding protein
MVRLKRSRATRSAAALICVAVLATVLAGCGSEAKGSADHHYVIGWSNPQGAQPLFQNYTAALTAAADRAGIDIVTTDAQANPSKQASDIQHLILKDVDAIIIFPTALEPLKPALAKARAKGIKIVALNGAFADADHLDSTPEVPQDYDANLDLGYVRGGIEAGQFLAEQLGGKGNMIGLNLPIAVPSLDAMMAAYKKGATDGNPDMKWLGVLPDKTDDLAGGRLAMQDGVVRYDGNIQAVVSFTDVAGIGATQALVAAGLKDVLVVGLSGNQVGIDAVEAGTLAADIDVRPYDVALYSLQLTRDILDGEDFPKYVESPVTLITKDNLGEYQPWDQAVAAIADGTTPIDITLSSDG